MTTTRPAETLPPPDGEGVPQGSAGPGTASAQDGWPGQKDTVGRFPAGAPASGPPIKPRRVWREQVLIRAEELASYAASMDSVLDTHSTRASRTPPGGVLDIYITAHLTNAREAACGVSLGRASRSARMERAFAEIDAAEAAILFRAPDSYVLGQLPSIVTHVRAHLPPSHPERVTTERLAEELPAGRAAAGDATRTSLPTPASGATAGGATAGGATASGATASGATASGAAAGRATAGGATAGSATPGATVSRTAAPGIRTGVLLPRDPGAPSPWELTDQDRVSLVRAVQSASSAARREHTRLRSFRNVVIMTTVAMLVLAGSLAWLGARHPDWIPLCFAPQGLQSVVCPTTTAALPNDPDTDLPATDAETAEKIAETVRPHDVALVMLIGLGAAGVTGAAALRHIRGSSTPFAVPVALVALKLPTGALTALLGLLLINGGFVPGLSALDSSGQILAWALVFGAAQQLVTGLVDKKAQSVLDSVGPAPMTSEKE